MSYLDWNLGRGESQTQRLVDWLSRNSRLAGDSVNPIVDLPKHGILPAIYSGLRDRLSGHFPQ